MVNKNDYSVYVLLLYSGPPARTVHFSSIDITQAMGLVSPGLLRVLESAILLPFQQQSWLSVVGWLRGHSAVTQQSNWFINNKRSIDVICRIG